jgi:hypothetical protein
MLALGCRGFSLLSHKENHIFLFFHQTFTTTMWATLGCMVTKAGLDTSIELISFFGWSVPELTIKDQPVLRSAMWVVTGFGQASAP